MSLIRVNCMQGIGDNLYARPFVQKLAHLGGQVYVQTPLPELFSDLSVRFLKPEIIKYRTQQRSFDESNIQFSSEIEFDKTISFYYGRAELRKRNIIAHMEHSFGFDPAPFIKYTLPPNLKNHGLKLPKKKIAIIKPVTLRNEWLCSSRAPLPQYVSWCAKILKDAGYYVISIADTDGKAEWIEGDEPPADLKLHHGELGIMQTLSLIKEANIVVGGSGFIIPAAISAGVPLFVIFGGRGEYDNPHKLFDMRMSNFRKIGWALPDNFCRCNNATHDCNKRITDLDDQFMKFMRDVH